MSASSASFASSKSTKAASTPIKVGEICSCSGVPGFSQFSVPSQEVVKAWAKSVNASGGINGHPIQLIAEDDGTNPGTSYSDAKTLIADHVVAIIDDTTLVDSWASLAEQAKIPVVGNYTINTPFDTSPDFYAEGQTNSTTLQAVVDVAKFAGAKTIGNMYCAEAPVCAQSVPFVESAGKALHVPDVFNAAISATAPNYTAPCVAAKQAGVRALFIGDAAAVDNRVAANCAQQGFEPIYVTEGAGFDMSQASAPAISKNLWSQYPDIPFWVNSPAVKTFNRVMDKYFPGVRTNTGLFTEDAFMDWVSGKLLQAGIQAGGLTARGTPSASEVTKGLESLHNDTLGGLAPPLSFPAGKPHPQTCFYIGRIQSGHPALANHGRPICLKPLSSQ